MCTDGNKTILLIEDSPDLRAATQDLLASVGYRVVVASSVADAPGLAQTTAFDLLVVNAYPAEGNGIEVVDRIRQVKPSAPALLVSGFGDDPGLRRRVLAGNVGFLAIPFSLDALAAKIEECLDQAPTPTPSGSKSAIPAQQPTPRSWSTRSRPWLAAAAAVLVVALVIQFRVGSPELPAPDLADARRSATIEIIEPRGEIAVPPTRLAWRKVPEAVSYKIVVQEVDGTVVWQTETTMTIAALPPSVISRLKPAVSYRWQVEGFTQDFFMAGKSTSVDFRLLPQPATPESATPRARRD